MLLSDEQSWWEAFGDSPDRTLEGVLQGGTAVSPYERADANEVLVTLFRPLEARDRRLDRLDDSLRAWFIARLADGPEQVAEGGWNAYVSIATEALTTALRLPLEGTRQTLRDRYDEFRPWAEGLSLGAGPADLLGLYLRVLARTQEDRRFLGLWYDLCEEAGRAQAEDPALARARLSTGLMGLRELPYRDDDAPQPGDELLDGLARWARHLSPDAEPLFRKQWALIEAWYPRAEGYWADRLQALLPRLGAKPFVRWWRDAVGLKEETAAAVKSGWKPSKADTDTFLKKMAKQEGAALEAAVDDYRKQHQAWADATGDNSQLPQALNRVGNALLKRGRADLALNLVRVALEYERNNEHNWTLWAMALRRLGQRNASETVLWEAARRLPDDAHVRVSLAQTLTDDGRLDEAEAVLRESQARFPENAAAYTALGKILLEQRLEAEAEHQFREARRRSRDERHGRQELGLLLVRQHRFDEVPPLLAELEKMGAKRETRNLRTALEREQQGLDRREREEAPDTQAAAVDAGLDDPAWAGLRETAGAMRAGFRLSRALDHPDLKLMTRARREELQAEARQQLQDLLRTHRSHPVVRLVAMRVGLVPRENLETLAAAAPGDFTLQLELARQHADYRDFEGLFRRFPEGRPLTAAVWIQDQPDGGQPAAFLRGWLQSEAPAEPPLEYLRRNLREMMGGQRFEAGEDLAFAEAWDEYVLSDQSTLDAAIDIALLGMVARQTPYAALHAPPESAVAAA